MFQLQRRAFEARGEGDWDSKDREVPVTSEETLLSDLVCDKCAGCSKLAELHCECERLRGGV
ncbi:hypothetical protein K491DRAFT_699045 [Lophiostoma macrostomum CBS 122681]|uniref:Uncharacterized protein n=1 Tax=Lophiostoma macrostomum CBS 122681 TaxID=1314788 RepID=A0A6A6SQ14_9PLEO|nr:hypothetical protein K491DRAFT_699045 [Lophiostoma macrostomum CBS 122681]